MASTGALSTTLPAYITATRAAVSATSPKSCVISIELMCASRFKSFNRSMICAWMVTSKAVVAAHNKPQQNGMVERLIRTLKEQCVHRHRFETQQHAMRVISDWIQFYNHRRPHQALAMKTPAQAYALTA